MTPREAAEKLGVSQSLIYGVLKAGKLKGMRVGCRGRGKWLIDPNDFEAWKQSCKVTEWPEPDDGQPYQYLS
jgi:excisionase family DNA binding protein